MPKKTKPDLNQQSAGEIARPSRRRSTTAKKKSSGKIAATTRQTGAPPRSSSSKHEPTDEEIRLRAYFISERRHRLDLGGDASSDWLEAKRQLLSETVRPN